jgi:hypothetical protein
MTNAAAPTPTPFMLLFRNAGPETHAHLTPEQKAALAKQWNDWFERLAGAGKFQHGQPLALDGRVVSGASGERVTDGLYSEATEAVGGYFFITAANLDEATAIAKQCPGLPLGLTVEVRPLAAFSPVLSDVRARPAEA